MAAPGAGGSAPQTVYAGGPVLPTRPEGLHGPVPPGPSLAAFTLT
jgi:hypothetical protein